MWDPMRRAALWRVVKGLRTHRERIRNVGNFVSLSPKDPKRLGLRSFSSTHTTSLLLLLLPHACPPWPLRWARSARSAPSALTGLHCKFLNKKGIFSWLFCLLVLCFCWFTGVVLDLCAVRSGRSFLRRIEWASHQGARRGWLLRRGSACDSHAYRDYHPRHTHPECARLVRAAFSNSCRGLGFRFGTRLRPRGRVSCKEQGL